MRGPLALAAALVAGVLIGDARGPASATPVLVGSIVGLIVAFGLRTKPAGVMVAVLATLMLGVAVEQRALHGLTVSPISTAVETRAHGDAVLTLTEDPDGPQFQTEAVATMGSFRGRDAGSRRVLAIASGEVMSALGVLDAGDRLRASGSLAPLHGYSTRLRWRHAVAEFHIDDVMAVARPDRPWYRIANQAREVVLRGGRDLPATPRALLAGFLLGDTRAIPDDLVLAFRHAGLSHLLAVSGANVAFALAIVEPALRRLRRGPRFVVGLGVIVLFGTMTRWEPSVLRASVMAGLVMVARTIGRPADAARVLVLAMMLLLVTDPFLLHSVGFQLSCGACAGIVVGSRVISGWLRGPAWFREALGVTTAAQIGVAPVILTTFGALPLVALPANLLAAPFVGPLTVWGLVASVAGALLGRGAALWLQLPTLTMLRSIEVIARTAAKFPLNVDGRAGVVGGVVCGVGVVLARASGRSAIRLRLAPRPRFWGNGSGEFRGISFTHRVRSSWSSRAGRRGGRSTGARRHGGSRRRPR